MGVYQRRRIQAKELVRQISGSLSRTSPSAELIDGIQRMEQGDNPSRRAVEAVFSLTSLNANDPRDKVFGYI